VEASRELIIQNRQMVALDLDLPLPLPINEMKVAPRYTELIEALRKCDFRSLVVEVEREAQWVQSAVTDAQQRPGHQKVKSEKMCESEPLSPPPYSPLPIPQPPAQGELF
jgi:hypothetical protein